MLNESSEFRVECKICGRRFQKHQELGGHSSKAHPKQSEIYAKKMIRRAEREPDREILLVAKKIFQKLYPSSHINSMRPKIASLKARIRKLMKVNSALSIEDVGQIVLSQFEEKLN